jgi:hypothetical protein
MLSLLYFYVRATGIFIFDSRIGHLIDSNRSRNLEYIPSPGYIDDTVLFAYIFKVTNTDDWCAKIISFAEHNSFTVYLDH